MLRIRQVKVEVSKNSEENILNSICKKLKISKSRVRNYSILKQSLDARNKDEIYYVYEVDVNIDNEKEILRKNHSSDISISSSNKYSFSIPSDLKVSSRPIIVGSGPAGLFCAYLLAEAGCNPIIIERGEEIDKRVETVSKFWEIGILNPNSNVQFGEGGAGTFSDGKLNTLVSDEFNRGRKVFETFVECGAPEEILYSYKPHIGTDLLVKVIKNLRNKIIDMGGTFLYETCLTDIIINDGSLVGIEVNNKDTFNCETLVLAIGHSSRDTFEMLLDKDFNMEVKPFAVGVRVQHNQDMIDYSQYGDKYYKLLSKATYKLTYKASNGRGVYSFCMCPGGYVVNASSEDNHLVINGMSNHDRDSKNANSAIVVTVFPRDFGTNPLDGVKYQRMLEKKAYEVGKGKIPVQLLKDFYDNKITNSFGNVEPIFKGDYVFSNLNEILPNEIRESLKEAFPNLGKKIKGFDNGDTILAGIESRTSSPVRIIRDEDYVSNIDGVYPCGEGAGYAGGITSAAIDGLKVAEAILKKYEGNK